MIPSAQLSQAGPQPHQPSGGGVGEEAWLWFLELADLTTLPQCLALCLTWALPRGGTGLWGVYGTARERWLLTG